MSGTSDFFDMLGVKASIDIKTYEKDIKAKDKEIERLNNIINNAIETIKDEGLVVAIKITNGEEETLLSSKELLLDILKESDKE